ncbi:hypothetical protein TSAR_005489 [Trichomalopsis sarcophagae]|uniref:Uncharacterized protein n=1 Tax=Trichomalopsis sarcophagae TaxID=543379 RepID=A0A232EQM9_9HYME|nr:hypothetical protein TSAR_005489 [Trichomalopsis sarcophagae]
MMLTENKKAHGRRSETGWTLNIHKSVKSDLSAIMPQVKRLERRQVALKRARRALD